MEFDYRKYGFKMTDDNTFIDEDGIVEVYRIGDGWGYTSHIIGLWESDDYGFDSPVAALQKAYEMTPTDYHIRKAIERAFDDLEDWEKLAVAREMYVEHDYPFEWSDTFDLEDVLGWSSRDELIHIIVSGSIRNATDPVRYDGNNNLVQVTDAQLRSEVSDNRDEIVDAIIDTIRDNNDIYAVSDFDDVCESFVDGSWKEED